MKIIADEKIPFLEGRIEGAELVRLPAPEITRDVLMDADALMTRTRTHCDASLLEGTKVKMVATATIGTDHIDLDWCRANGIEVRNAPGCNAPGVALYVWSSLLRSGFDPKGKTIGVVGHGNVGSVVARWGEILGAEVLVCDPPRKEAGFTDREYLSLEEVLAKSDAVTLHTPLTRTGAHPTFHLINKSNLKCLRQGAFFVNAARGEVLESEAVSDAIESGQIAKAIIDTWEGEPALNRRLLALADVATTHIAGYSVEGKQRATRMALEAIRDFFTSSHLQTSTSPHLQTFTSPHLQTSTPPDLHISTAGLAGPYEMPSSLPHGLVMAHYDPAEMTTALKSRPEDFEKIRNAYPLHVEV